MWNTFCNSYIQPIRWYRTASVGCAVNLCGKLSGDDGFSLTNSYLIICKYSPSYFMSSDGSLFKKGPCRNSTCPKGVGVCVTYNGAARPSDVQLYPYCGKYSPWEEEKKKKANNQYTFCTWSDCIFHSLLLISTHLQLKLINYYKEYENEKKIWNLMQG